MNNTIYQTYTINQILNQQSSLKLEVLFSCSCFVSQGKKEMR